MKNRSIKIILGIILVISFVGITYLRVNYHQSSQAFSTDFASNEDNGYKKSEFVEFSGNDYYDIDYKNFKKVYYKYSSDLSSGDITLKLIVNNKEVWSSDKLKGQNINDGEIDIHDIGKLKLRVVGKNATGKYGFEWVGK